MAKGFARTLADGGMVIVPREPTALMVVQGARAMTIAAVNQKPQSAVIFGQPKEIYKAMITKWEKG